MPPVSDFLYAVDHGIYPLFELSAQSVLAHNPGARIHLVCLDCDPPENRAVPITSWLRVSTDEVKEHVKYDVTKYGFHWGYGAAARFMVQRMEHLHNVIYLDCDTLCLKPIDLEPVPAIACARYTRFGPGDMNATAEHLNLVFPTDADIAEAGVLVLNVDWMREVDFITTLYTGLEVFQEILRDRLFAENIGIPLKFASDITWLPLKYNCGWRDFRDGHIAEKDAVIYHIHQEVSGITPKVIFAKNYLRRGPINVAYITDDSTRSIMMMEISMQSVLRHNPSARIYVVSTVPLKGNFINVVMPLPDSLLFEDRPHCRHSRANLLKFCLPRLPVDRLIYLDTDTYCSERLDELWALTKKAAIHMVERPGAPKERCALVGGVYHNAGVMALNLAHLRSIDFEAASLAWTPPPPSEVPPHLWMADETLINTLWRAEIRAMPEKWNVPYPGRSPGVIHHFMNPNQKKRFLGTVAAMGGFAG